MKSTALLALAGIAGLGVVVSTQGALGIGVALLNAAAFTLFARDKLHAQSGGARVSEAALHLVSLLGGAGASAGRHWFRHKTLKPTFTVSSLAGVALLWALALWRSPSFAG